ncbi:MAG TPA: thioredoxin domain-containing protein [Anaerolineales bacterium]|nr:thioredoxin domain-containing protein [Anaerolineales bacterium]
MPNHLAGESSPYLLQHKDNPVDWYPWGDDALTRARVEGKPIFLSIGYSACHWCHVMEHESFENADLAALLNTDFISIKVDREERPELDTIYMDAVVAMTGHGGWPMSVWLTPQGVPFYGGTYFPPERRGQHPGFGEVLGSIAQAWKERRPELLQGSEQLLKRLSASNNSLSNQSTQPLTTGTLDRATRTLWQGFDARNGGWSAAPKFPQPMVIEFLLQQHYRTGDALALAMAEETLRAMACGGIYDQLGGGFHRYSVDTNWLVPHFEKMLYDNSQLARLYLHAYQLTGKGLYRRIATETLDYVLREMTHSQGGFYSTQDADSEGQEGKFFVWSADEIRATVPQHAELVMAALGVTAHGNFEGVNVLHVKLSTEALGAHFGMVEADVNTEIARARAALWARREERVWPGLDDKIITAWNGLMLAAVAEAARVLDRADYRTAAIRNAEFLLDTLRGRHGRLLRTWRAGSSAKLNAYLSDYACLAEGLLQLYQTTFDQRWYLAAHQLADSMLAHFSVQNGAVFFDTSADHETLVVRPKTLQDNTTPSGSAMAAGVLLKLGAYSGEGRFTEAAENALRTVQNLAGSHPTSFGRWLQALSFAVSSGHEIAIIGAPDATDTRALLAAAQHPYRPHQVVACCESPDNEVLIPLLSGRTQKGNKATAYVCRDFECRLPVTDADALRRQLH